MSKAAVAHLTKCLAVEWGRYNITVNAVAPTFIRTPGTEAALADPAFAADVRERIAGLHRVGEPMDVAGARRLPRLAGRVAHHRHDAHGRRRLDRPMSLAPLVTGHEFATVFGRELIGELPNFVHRPYLVVTMADLWPRFEHHFDSHLAGVYCVTTLDLETLEARSSACPPSPASSASAVDRPATWPSSWPGRAACRSSRSRPR